jgi:hypothetical protein
VCTHSIFAGAKQLQNLTTYLTNCPNLIAAACNSSAQVKLNATAAAGIARDFNARFLLYK